MRAPLAPAAATAAAVQAIRDAGVGGIGPDRFLAPELAAAEEAVLAGSILAAVEASIGPLE
jgi:histidine ammonia-lyase